MNDSTIDDFDMDTSEGLTGDGQDSNNMDLGDTEQPTENDEGGSSKNSTEGGTNGAEQPPGNNEGGSSKDSTDGGTNGADNEENVLDPLDIIMKTYFDFLTEDEEESAVRENLRILGVKSISDLKYVQHGIGLKEAFHDVLNVVQMGKLVVAMEKQKPPFDETAVEQPRAVAINYEEVFSPKLLRELTNAESRVSDQSRKMVAWAVTDHLFATSMKPTLRRCKGMAMATFKKFERALRSSSTSKQVTDVAAFASAVFNHWKYLQRKENKKKVDKRSKLASDAVSSDKFTKRQTFGIDAELDMPTCFPDGETRETQVKKQTKLQQMHTTGEITSNKEVLKLMSSTYVLQRFSVNAKKNMEQILVDWPFFGKFRVLEKHFSKLMEVNMKEVEDRLVAFVPGFIKYLIAEGDKTRKGENANVAPQIRDIMKEFQKFEQNSTEGNGASQQFAAAIMCIIIKLKENIKSLFIFFEETSSYDEVQASTKLPDDGTPRVAVLGKDIFEAEKCFVVVEKRIISTDSINLLKGIFSAFMMYWVLKLLYPRNLAGTMQFLEREIFCLDLDENSGTSRVERGKDKNNRWKTCPPPVNKRYLSMMNEYSNYCDRWN